MAKKWREELVEVLAELGGEATLEDIYQAVERRRSPLTPAWKASVRGVLESNSSDSDRYRPSAPDVFCMPRGKFAGVWALRQGRP